MGRKAVETRRRLDSVRNSLKKCESDKTNPLDSHPPYETLQIDI